MAGNRVVRSVRKATKIFRAVQPICEGIRTSSVEALEHRQLMSGDPSTIQSLPYVLDFTSAQPGILDKNSLGTGFTRVQVNKNGNQYQPALITLNTAAGELDLKTTGTSSAGTNYGTDNTQVDALETQFDGTTSGFTITARLKGPLTALNAPYFSGGIYLGPDQDNYIKIVALDDATKGQTLQFTDEQNGVTHTVNAYQSIGSFSNVQILDLRLTGDAGTGNVTASYAVNGGSFVSVPGTVTLTGTEKTAIFSTAARAGIMVGSKNNLAPITLGFTHFEIDAGTPVAGHPSVAFTAPANSATGVAVDQPIEADLNLPNSAIDSRTITAANVYLFRNSDKSVVSATVNTSGGGDSIILSPSAALAPNTQYTFVVTAGVLDTTGASMSPYTMSFTTGAAPNQVDPSIQFQKVSLPSATGAAFTCVAIGPDHKLYASTEDGRIFRWSMNPDGTLGTPQIYNSLQLANGGNRLITGFAFDPSSTASNPILWVSNSYYALSGATTGLDFTGKITVISGANLQIVQDAVVNLPRSVADHSTEQPSFGPDGALYFAQASNTAYGAPDSTWGNRPEHMLTAAVLRLDITKITPGTPLDVKTTDAGGTYNPFAAGAPLTIYATGVRNAFDMVWTADGSLFAPTNGSSAGGNAPAYSASNSQQINGNRIDTGVPYSGVNVPGLTKIQQTEDDYLYRIAQGGYYGHPNPTRGEYVLDGGNPSSGTDPAEFTAYPVGTQPDANYKGYNWDFGPHRSADGIIEYQDKTFGGALQNALLVTEYSAGGDIVVLRRDANGNVVSATRGIAGFTGLSNPVDLVEDPATGNIYVSELGAMRLTLLRPITPQATASVSKSIVVFNDIAPSYSGGSATSATQAVVITNTGSTALTFGAGAFTFANDSASATLDAAQFKITNLASLPTSLAQGASMTLQMTYTSNHVGVQYAKLLVTTNDPSGPLTVYLRGIGTTGTGGANEPSLPRILRAYGIPTITGDGANDANQNQTFYPATPDASSQEVEMQRLIKAGNGPVTIQLLASFNAAGASNAALARVGYYTPGSTSTLDRTELFTLAQADAQTTNPTALGATTFDPGSASFGLYSIFPHFTDSGHARISYSEDALNTWDATVPRKLRFFPLQNPDGSVVPNAYVFAFEDNNIPFGAIQPYDSNDIVGIIRNVAPAANAVNAPVIGVENVDGAPASNRMVFNRIQVPNTDLPGGDLVHDTGNLLIRNTGGQPLVISSLTLSDTTNWTLVNAPALPFSIAPGATLTLTVKFIAQKAPTHTINQTNDTTVVDPGYSTLTAAGVWSGTLTIGTNDPVTPSKPIALAGWWQHISEHEEEPGLQTLVNMIYGYGTQIASTPLANYTEGDTTPTYYGEELVSAYWNVADTSNPVTAIQLAGLHNQLTTTGTPTTPFFGWNAKGAATHTTVIKDQTYAGQMFLPPASGIAGPATASFTPSATTFGFDLDGNFSDDTLNTVGGGGGHHVRFYPLRDSAGNLVANSYIVALDYGSATYENYDFQDLLFIVRNIKPAGGTPVPTDAQATNGAAGVTVQWAKVSDSTLVGYNVYRGSSPTGTFTKLTSTPITATSYLDAFAPAGITSYYRVSAVDAVGESIGTSSFAMTAPGAPTNVTATPMSATQIKLIWNAASGAASYRVEREVLGDGAFVEIASGITTTTFTDNGLQPGVTYVYQIRDQNAAGLSGYSIVAVATTKLGVAAPGAPTSVLKSLNSSNQIVLSWTSSTGTVTSYHVERQAPGGSFVEVATGIVSNTFTDTTASALVTYNYRIRAENSGLFSAYSATIVGTSGLYAPTGLVATPVASGEIDLSWSVPTEPVTLFHIERADTGGFAEIGTSAVTTFQDMTAVAGVSYTYRVRVENSGSFSPYGVTAPATIPQNPPAAPAVINATANTATQITVTWNSVPGANSYWLERKGPADADFVPVAMNLLVTTFVDQTALASSTYTYQVRAHNVTGYSGFVIATPVTTPTSSLFSSLDINSTPTGSTNTVNDGVDYDVTAGGLGVYGNADSFRYVYESLTGNFDVKVQINNMTGIAPGTYPQAGLVARSTLDPASPTVALTASPTGGYRFKYRATNGAAIVQTQTGSAVVPNVYIRMTRVGNVFTTYYSANGTTWTKYGTVTLTLGNTIQVGMGAMSNAASTTVVQFRGFGPTTGAVAPAAPTGVSATATGTSTIAVGWTAVTGAASYTVLRQSPGSAMFNQVATGLTTTTFGDTGLAAGTTYSYEIVAMNSAGSSAVSTSAGATTQNVVVSGPAAPTGLQTTAKTTHSVTLSWTASVNTVTAYHVERAGSDNIFHEIAPSGAGTTYVDATAEPSTSYTYRVRAENAGVMGNYGNSIAVTTPKFDSADIGAVPGGSTSIVNEGTDYDVTAGGPGIYNNADGFRFLSQSVTGDFDVRVQLTGLTAGGTIPQAGLMARSTLDAASPEVSITASSTASTSGIFRFKSRATSGAVTNQTQLGQATFPNVWMRLTRVGNLFTTYYSTDGTTWTKAGSITIALPSTVQVGLAAASNVSGSTTTAQFRNFTGL